MKNIPINNSQNYSALYLVNSSGCGKTKLAFSLGLQNGFSVVPIRLFIKKDSTPVHSFFFLSYNININAVIFAEQVLCG